MEFDQCYRDCVLCPRACHVDRLSGKRGACGESALLRAGRAGLHMWEEPCLSGEKGSGAVFFSGCTLNCLFCQNHALTREGAGEEISEERLAEIFLELQEKGAANINLVTGEHFVPGIVRALSLARERGLSLPVVYNSSGYECVETLRLLDGWVDIYLPDFKYWDDDLAFALSGVRDYRSRAMEAIGEMVRQTGEPVFDEEGYMQRGVIVRQLVLPGHVKDAMRVMEYLFSTYHDRIYLSIMSQYTPVREFTEHQELNRRLTRREYEKILRFASNLGITRGFVQEGESAKESFIPAFDGEGVHKE